MNKVIDIIWPKPRVQSYPGNKLQLKTHYELEKRLAQKIINADENSRAEVTRGAYDELYQTITWHPGIGVSKEERYIRAQKKFDMYRFFLPSSGKILELGCGSGELCEVFYNNGYEHIVGIDASISKIKMQHNIKILQRDITNIDKIFDETFDVVISYQVFEHLYPDDVPKIFSKVFKLLNKGGIFCFDTPSSVGFPRDISKFFDRIPKGFHLKEWKHREIYDELKKAGFKGIYTPIIYPFYSSNLALPCKFKCIMEDVIEKIPSLIIQEYLGMLTNIEEIRIIAKK